jgi:hypothetical protein
MLLLPMRRTYFSRICLLLAFFLLTGNLTRAQELQNTIDRLQKQITTLIASERAADIHVHEAATSRIDSLQQALGSMDADNKERYLQGLNDVLNGFIAGYTSQHIPGTQFPDLLSAYAQCVQAGKEDASIAPVIDRYPLETGNILVKNNAFAQNSGLQKAKELLVLKECRQYPDHILPLLSHNPGLPGTDALIVTAARNNPDQLYNYAAAHDSLASRIRSSRDSLVRLLVKMAAMKSGRQYFPFLDDLYRGKQTFAQINKSLQSKVKYYQLLVKTQISYAGRLMKGDTPLVMKTLTAKLQQTGRDEFLNTINGLHELPDATRFQKIKQLTPAQLYYLAVLQEEEMYTSSYTHGIYPLIFKKMKVPRGDSLLMLVNFDHFKKWIKMAANYNTLDHFLKTMDKDHAQLLMKAFVKGLEKTNNLEDAVDVANSYASMTDPALQQLVLGQVKENLDQAKASGQQRMTHIYQILYTLFQSMDPASQVDVAKTLGITPVYFLPNQSLRDSTGKIIIQQFFYGDDGGKTDYAEFVRSFSNSNWDVQSTSNWIAFTSKKGVPLTIYSNKPLDEQKNLDALAQKDLVQYLKYNHLKPSMVIHRGHSYYVNSTIEQLAPSAKLVMLGSCGGYQSLHQVLSICPQAQIIASKQTGTGNINQPMINTLIDSLRQGKDLDWPQIWNSFGKMFKGNSLFEDYVPPYRNLGAVFITAYQHMTATKKS